MARFARLIERETEIFVEDKDAENTEKVTRSTSRKRKLQNPNKRLLAQDLKKS